jgi:hypothetical protein
MERQMILATARGEDILFDDEDAMTVLRFSWVAVPAMNGRFYAVARLAPNVRMSMHRYLLQPPAHLVIHHKNNNGLDNRRQNLVITTTARNTQASKLESRPSVHLHKASGKWRVQMRVDGKRQSFGLYPDKEEALAVAEAVRKERLASIESEFLG